MKPNAQLKTPVYAPKSSCKLKHDERFLFINEVG